MSTDRLLDQAEGAADESNWQRVRELSQNILAFDPENTDALGFLAAADRSLPETASTPNSQSTSVPTVRAPTTPAQPTSFANGRYQVKRFLGETDPVEWPVLRRSGTARISGRWWDG